MKTIAFLLLATIYATYGQVRTFKAELKTEDGMYGTLYMSCKTDLVVNLQEKKGNNWVEVKELKDIGVSVPADQGFVIHLADNKFSVVPTQRKLNISITYAGQLVQTLIFEVKSPPTVRDLEILIDGQEYNDSTGIASSARQLIVKPRIYDENFIATMKGDSHYMIESFALTVRQASIPVKGNKVDLEAFHLKKNETIAISHVKVTRTNYEGKSVDVQSDGASKVIKVK